MKALAVCGFGVGSSMVLKMTVERVLNEVGISGEVENTDISTAQSVMCDVIFTSPQFAETLEGTVKAKIYPIKKYMDAGEVKVAVEDYLNSK